MMAKQRAQAGRGHGLSTVPTLQRDEQCWRVGQRRPFQAQVAFEHFEDFWGQRHNALLISFAKRTQLSLGELQIF